MPHAMLGILPRPRTPSQNRGGSGSPGSAFPALGARLLFSGRARGPGACVEQELSLTWRPSMPCKLCTGKERDPHSRDNRPVILRSRDSLGCPDAALGVTEAQVCPRPSGGVRRAVGLVCVPLRDLAPVAHSMWKCPLLALRPLDREVLGDPGRVL